MSSSCFSLLFLSHWSGSRWNASTSRSTRPANCTRAGATIACQFVAAALRTQLRVFKSVTASCCPPRAAPGLVQIPGDGHGYTPNNEVSLRGRGYTPHREQVLWTKKGQRKSSRHGVGVTEHVSPRGGAYPALVQGGDGARAWQLAPIRDYWRGLPGKPHGDPLPPFIPGPTARAEHGRRSARSS